MSSDTTKVEITGTLNQKIRLVNTLCLILIVGGIISLIFSIIFSTHSSSASILAFIGLGLVFWGILLIFIQPEEYLKQVVFDNTIFSSLKTLSKVISELDYKGTPIYLPPKFFKNTKITKVFISKDKVTRLPETELITYQEKSIFIKNPEGLLFDPAGSELSGLFEKKLIKNFAQMDLDYFKRVLPKLLIEDLELAEKIDFEIVQNKESGKNLEPSVTINLKLENSILKNIYGTLDHVSNFLLMIGCPVISSIACALSQVTGKPLTIQNIQSYKNGETIKVTFNIPSMIYAEKVEPPMVKFVQTIPQFDSLNSRFPLFSKILPLLLMVFGLIILVWIGNLTLNDVALYSKNIDVVLFQTRTGEGIDLGIGMKVIYYYIIGFFLLLSGAFLNSRIRSQR